MRDHDLHHFLFFADRVDADTIELDAEEARHAASVLRHAPGDSITVTDGNGTLCDCRVDSVNHGRLTATVVGRATAQRHACRLHLLVGLPERDAFETLVTDLAALGVERITPIAAAHCQRPWWEPWAGKPSLRLRAKMIAGMKQSLYPFLPRLDPPCPVQYAGDALSGFALVADAQGSPFSTILARVKGEAENRFACLVGPPGGFSIEEVASLRTLGALPVKIAGSRLTTELAAVVLASEILGVCLG